MTPHQRVLFLQLQIAGMGIVIAVMAYILDYPILYYVGGGIFLFGLGRLLLLSGLLKDAAQASHPAVSQMDLDKPDWDPSAGSKPYDSSAGQEGDPADAKSELDLSDLNLHSSMKMLRGLFEEDPEEDWGIPAKPGQTDLPGQDPDEKSGSSSESGQKE